MLATPRGKFGEKGGQGGSLKQLLSVPAAGSDPLPEAPGSWGGHISASWSLIPPSVAQRGWSSVPGAPVLGSRGDRSVPWAHIP